MRTRKLLPALLAGLALAGCGGSGGDGGDGGADEPKGPPVLGRDVEAEAEEAAEELGFPGFATKNTTRIGGADPVADAAGAALAVYPSASRDSRPSIVTLVDADDWRSAISAAQLVSRPLRAPILLTKDGEVPPAAEDALEALQPTGAPEVSDAQVIRVGDAAAVPEDLESRDLAGEDPAVLARAIDGIATTAAGRATEEVIVAPSDRPPFAMPAAGLAAKTGAPVLWTNRRSLPGVTAAAIRSRENPRIYVIGPEEAVSQAVIQRLQRLGDVERIAGDDPVANAIAVARYADGAFGWNVIDPGHGLVFASAERPADAAAGASLSGAGTYGPLLLVTDAGALPAALQSYLLDIQPGYDRDPVRGVYNHGWLMGDEEAISVAVQARIDSLLEIQPVDRSQ